LRAAAASPGCDSSSDDLADNDDNHLTRAGPITKHQIQQSTTRIQHSHTCSRTPVLTFLHSPDGLAIHSRTHTRIPTHHSHSRIPLAFPHSTRIPTLHLHSRTRTPDSHALALAFPYYPHSRDRFGLALGLGSIESACVVSRVQRGYEWGEHRPRW
jgi:hypothetical protein